MPSRGSARRWLTVAWRHGTNTIIWGGNRGCPGSSVRDTEGGVLHVMGAPG
jgi:hypothetical protein